MNEAFKQVKNPLFSAAVTGSTLEEFSQNALLLPAQEKTTSVSLPTQDEILYDILPNKDSTNFNQLPPSNLKNFQNQGLPTLQLQENISPQCIEYSNNFQQESNSSAVLSSFSNILHTGVSNKQETILPSVTETESFIHPEISPAPIPLFPSSTTPITQPKPPSTKGPVNVYRRTTLKRPTYAPVPGLSNASSTVAANIPRQLDTSAQNQSNITASSVPLANPISSISSSKIEQFPYCTPDQFKSTLTRPLPTFNQFSQSSQLLPISGISGNLQNLTISPNELLLNNNMASSTSDIVNLTNPTMQPIYRPVYHHWFFQKETVGKISWQPFSMVDSLALEQAFTSNPDKIIATDGGRYDVNILRRQRTPVYWNGSSTEIRRCSWFHKCKPDGRLVPYEENVATKLEEEFKLAFESNQWHREVKLANGETVVFHGPDVLVLFPQSQSPDAWGNAPNQVSPRIVKRGMDEFEIDEGEPAQVDHILFMVHGIGSVCDLKFRSVEEVVDEFRNIALQLVQSHYRTSCENGNVHRIEVLPISWHEKLHSEETGIDKQLKSITLESIPKLRDFTNDTLLDILFYTSPVYCQTIISTVGNELNRIYDLFKQRNPDFRGGVSLGGHSLGSLILFDLLCHQDSKPEVENTEDDDPDEDIFSAQQEVKPPPLQRKMSRRISYMMGSVGTGQPQIYYPRLNFDPKTFFALGSPIGMFVIVRGLDTLGQKFSLPTCPGFFNIFHPYDPIAYRIESLIDSELGKLKPVLIPHHKGRKRMHLELKETMVRVGADLKQKVKDSVKNTWNSFYQLAMFHKPDQTLEEGVSKEYQENHENKPEIEEPQQELKDQSLGSLNKGRRIDYVLQEAPFEFFNEYIFALTSHVCYWESEDTILLMLKEIYSSAGISTDNQIPQQTMTIERLSKDNQVNYS